MRFVLTVAMITLCMGSSIANAADREKSRAQIETARAALEELKTNAGENKTASADLAAAAKYLDRASIALKQGEKMFGGISDEAEQEIRHQTSMVDLTLKLAASKIERSKIEAELAALSNKTETVRARVKIFDDFRAEIARLKGELANKEKAGKELAALKAEKTSLAAQLEKLTTEKELLEKVKEENEALKKRMSQLKGENDKPTRQPERIGSENPHVQSELKEVETFQAPKPTTIVAPLQEPELHQSLEEIIHQADQPSGK